MRRAAAILILAAGTAFAGEYDDIQVLRADERGIAFEYKPANVRLEAAGASGAMNSSQVNAVGPKVDLSQRLAIANCARTAAVGNYDLPVRIVLIGIPADARPEVNATVLGEAGFATASASRIGGRPLEVDLSTGTENLELMEEKRGMENRVVADAPFWIGNQRVLRVKIFPAAYDEGARQYRAAEKLQIEVRFNSSGQYTSASTTTGWEKILRHGILNYEQAKTFRGSSTPNRPLAKAVAFSSPFGQSTNWVKVTFTDNAIYRIDRTALAAIGVPVSTLDPRTFRIFSQGGRVLPAFNNVLRPDWKEHGIEVTGEGDGSFDSGDEIRFYGWGVEGWDYDTLSGNFGFAKSNYTATQVFWLTWGGANGLRIGSQNVAPGGGTPTVSSFPARLRFEQDRILAAAGGSDINDYYNWYGGRGASQTYFFNLPNLVPNVDTIKVGHLSAGVSLSVNNNFATQIGTSAGVATFQTGALKAGLNRVDLGVASQIFTGYNHFDYLEIFYNRSLVYAAPGSEFETPPASGPVNFQISSSPAGFVLWDISSRFAPVLLTGANRNTAGVLSFDVDATQKRLFFLTSTADFKRPVLSRPNPVDLTTGPNQGEFIIIAPQAFQSALTGYAAHRASFSGLTTVKQVAVEEIYNNFSGGLPDPVAIRDFLKFARGNWADPKPRYVLLVGDGTYDFRNLEGTGAINYIPPFIVEQAFDASSLSDEGYLYFGNPGILDSADQTLDMAIARWPVKNVSELQVIADKIRRYESSPEYGVWRNRVTLVADDEFGAFLNEGFHTDQMEDISRRLDTLTHSRAFDQKKIYLFDFPFDGLRQKPAANQAIVRAWNEGHVLIDYVGHGNPNVWAHERVFKREEDLPQLANGGRLPLVYAASCDINVFYEPLADGMGEDLIKNPNGGAVAVIAAVRIVFAGANTDLNFKVFDALFGSDSLSIGEAFYLGKLLRQYSGFPVPHPVTNDRRYILFGDPAMHLARPQYNVRLTVPDSLSALTVASVSGEVTDTLGNRLTGFNGTAQLFVFDGLRFKAHRMEAQPDNLIPYLLPGNMIYRGEAQVTAGQFSISFVVPKDISYGSKTGRVSAYAWNASGDAVGFEDSVSLSGSAAVTSDTSGPQITVATAANATVQAGDEISSGVGLKIVLEDSSGVNITGEPAHVISAQFDFPGGPSFDLTEAFRYEPQSFSRGEAAFTVPALEPGSHSLRIKAWDAANNSSVLEMSVEVVAAGSIQLSGVLNYPNPMKDKTNFCYTLSASADEVIIEIFSLAGRLIRTIRSSSTQAGYNFQTEWNGQDNDGDRVASGVYLYKVRARQASKETEEFGKLVVMR